MNSANPTPETRLSIRLQGPLADHVNQKVQSALYNSHSEYIRDLVRRDMAISGGKDADEFRQKVIKGYGQLAEGNYRDVSVDELFDRAMNELALEGAEIKA